jgi:hypothetical protein
VVNGLSEGNLKVKKIPIKPSGKLRRRMEKQVNNL